MIQNEKCYVLYIWAETGTDLILCQREQTGSREMAQKLNFLLYRHEDPQGLVPRTQLTVRCGVCICNPSPMGQTAVDPWGMLASQSSPESSSFQWETLHLRNKERWKSKRKISNSKFWPTYVFTWASTPAHIHICQKKEKKEKNLTKVLLIQWEEEHVGLVNKRIEIPQEWCF